MRCNLGIAAIEVYSSVLVKCIWKIQLKTNREGKIWHKQMVQQYLTWTGRSTARPSKRSSGTRDIMRRHWLKLWAYRVSTKARISSSSTAASGPTARIISWSSCSGLEGRSLSRPFAGICRALILRSWKESACLSVRTGQSAQ